MWKNNRVPTERVYQDTSKLKVNARGVFSKRKENSQRVSGLTVWLTQPCILSLNRQIRTAQKAVQEIAFSKPAQVCT